MKTKEKQVPFEESFVSSPADVMILGLDIFIPKVSLISCVHSPRCFRLLPFCQGIMTPNTGYFKATMYFSFLDTTIFISHFYSMLRSSRISEFIFCLIQGFQRKFHYFLSLYFVFSDYISCLVTVVSHPCYVTEEKHVLTI